MPKATALCNDWLALLFNGTAIADIAMNDSSGPLTELWIALHTANPGVTGDQTINEATYGGYTRISVVRTTLGWQVPGSGQTRNVEVLFFPVAIAGEETLTHVSIGTASSGAGRTLYTGVLAAGRLVLPGIQPVFIEEALVVQET